MKQSFHELHVTLLDFSLFVAMVALGKLFCGMLSLHIFNLKRKLF
jgi:hypothetical protein